MRTAAIVIAVAVVQLLAAPATASPSATSPVDVRIVTDAEGSKFLVNGEDFMIFGMNWGYMPIGENYLYSLWAQPDDVIEEALAREMQLLRAMGVNVIRQYAGIPPRWVEHIYERYGIYTVVNHPMGRYGFTLDGVWHPSVDYSDPRMRQAITAEIVALVDEFRNTKGMLFWLLGNENNYGLHWASNEIEALPEGERDAARARHLYSLFGDVTDAVKARDGRPVAIANGDIQYLDIIAEECRNIDIFGTNVYRGISARDLFRRVKDELGVPVVFTEFGADAWNAREMREDQVMQARYLVGQWREIYEQSAGKGRVGNAAGGFVFQWSDGWWKYLQDSNLDVHDLNASWPNRAYPEDFVEGGNNMNEEWWGITAKGRPDSRGLYEVYPRAAYYALQKAFRLDPYAGGTDLATIAEHFGAISPVMTAVEARGDKVALVAEQTERVRVSGVRMEYETFNTGGTDISTPESEFPQLKLPGFQGFDHQESFYTEFEVKPAENFTGNLSINILGNVAVNPIDEIYYENRGRRRTIIADGEPYDFNGIERVKVYGASVSWDDTWFHLDGFYRVGHTHWGYEGDFFGLYRDAFYGENIDIYNSDAPVGVEVSLKRAFEGLKFAYGPQLWWGANPSFYVKYTRAFGRVEATALFQEEFASQNALTSSIAVPVPPTRRATLAFKTNWGRLGIEIGGIWAGSTKAGDPFQIVEATADGYKVYVDEIKDSDAFGAKAKLTFETGRWHWYAQSAVAGLVADGGPTAIYNFTGWTLRDSGWSNQRNVMSGIAMDIGRFQIGPNFLWQKPIEDPIPADAPAPARPRNVLDDPFAVRYNRETVGAELVLAYDPTPATWMWAWDNDMREDASLAWSLGYVFRHLPTTMDAGIGIMEDGVTSFPFPNATPPRDLWEVHARIVSRLAPGRRVVAHFYGGWAEPNGEDLRKIERFGTAARITWGPLALATFAKFNDWGPYDYHRDFNYTYPVQVMGDISYAIGSPRWFAFPQTRVGIRGLWRSLDEYSNRYCPALVPGVGGDLVCDPTAPGDGSEWEIRTYLHVSL
ncbi:MAG: glycosidase [Candidatus Krumholzibacteriota bacterium]|nr:glycosidase [Candidatus Krumholzibacteriota bacterium]